MIKSNFSLEIFKSVAEYLSDQVIITDVDGHIVYANKALVNNTGYTQTEVLGKTPALWGKQMEQTFYEAMWQIIKEDKQVYQGELLNKRKNGLQYLATLVILPIFNQSNELTNFLGIEHDITEEKKKEKRRGEFVSFVSHQLRNPLTSMKWLLQMLEQKEIGEMSQLQRKYFADLREQNHNMLELVDIFLNTNRIEEGDFSVNPEESDINLLVKGILEKSEEKIKIKKIKLVEKYENDLPIINLDKLLLRLVVDNILTNAIKYTPAKGQVTVSTYFSKDDKNVIIIEITDTGYGIPSFQAKKVFDKYFRGDNIVDKEISGTGLGLYIAKKITDYAGIRIHFKSSLNKGTSFFIGIPTAGMKKKAGQKDLLT